MLASAALRKLNGARLWRRRLRVGGDTFRAPSLDRLVYLLLHRAGWMGGEEGRLLGGLVAPGATVVDVGANLGLYTALLARAAGPAGRVYAFEPEPTLYRALCANCRRNGLANVTPRNCALGRQAGRVAFYRSPLNSGDNRLGPVGGDSGLEVEMAPLDAALPQPRVDFIKMDVQGYELQVLEGMERVFAASPNLEIYFEYWPAGLRAAGTRPEALLEHLADRGYRLYRLEDGGRRRVTDFARLGDRLTGWRFVNLLASRS
jgi:FkbM family methyltransferase